ncbi:MAG: hypothetical protein QHH06_12580 [Clostridiales bacterium]|nr:hypothetical protein [Eubacteriales bacterium]MDH7567286.1 hypothetical protein [Clostridiales bacterium]
MLHILPKRRRLLFILFAVLAALLVLAVFILLNQSYMKIPSRGVFV